jgi:hypothetical protein
LRRNWSPQHNRPSIHPKSLGQWKFALIEKKPNFPAKLGPAAALSLTQLGRELHKNFSGSLEETHNELESRFMVGTLWSPKGPEGFWLGPSGPSCFHTSRQLPNADLTGMVLSLK